MCIKHTSSDCKRQSSKILSLPFLLIHHITTYKFTKNMCIHVSHIHIYMHTVVQESCYIVAFGIAYLASHATHPQLGMHVFLLNRYKCILGISPYLSRYVCKLRAENCSTSRLRGISAISAWRQLDLCLSCGSVFICFNCFLVALVIAIYLYIAASGFASRTYVLSDFDFSLICLLCSLC